MRDDQRDPSEVETTAEDAKASSPLDRPISRRELGRLALTTGVVLGANALWPKSWETPLVRVGPLPAHASTSADAYGLSATATPTSESACSVTLTNSSGGRTFHTVTLEWAKLRNTAPASRSKTSVSAPSFTTPISVTGLEADTVYYFWVKNVNPSPRTGAVNETYSQPSSARTFAFAAPTLTTASGAGGPTVSWTLPSGALGIELVARKTSGEERVIGAYPSSRTSSLASERPAGWQDGVTFKARAVAGGKNSAWATTS
jgi:hypothetical protein